MTEIVIGAGPSPRPPVRLNEIAVCSAFWWARIEGEPLELWAKTGSNVVCLSDLSLTRGLDAADLVEGFRYVKKLVIEEAQEDSR